MFRGNKMYTTAKKDTNKTEKNVPVFYTATPRIPDNRSTKLYISHSVVTILGEDIQNMSDYMVKTIMEGIVNGKKYRKKKGCWNTKRLF